MWLLKFGDTVSWNLSPTWGVLEDSLVSCFGAEVKGSFCCDGKQQRSLKSPQRRAGCLLVATMLHWSHFKFCQGCCKEVTMEQRDSVWIAIETGVEAIVAT